MTAMLAFAERIRSLLPPHHHAVATAHVALDRNRCEACWECVEACPSDVLGAVSLGPHRHAIMERPGGLYRLSRLRQGLRGRRIDQARLRLTP